MPDSDVQHVATSATPRGQATASCAHRRIGRCKVLVLTCLSLLCARQAADRAGCSVATRTSVVVCLFEKSWQRGHLMLAVQFVSARN